MTSKLVILHYWKSMDYLLLGGKAANPTVSTTNDKRTDFRFNPNGLLKIPLA